MHALILWYAQMQWIMFKWARHTNLQSQHKELSPDIHDWKYLFLIAALATALSTQLLAFTVDPDTDSRDIFIWLMIWFSIVDQMISLFIASPRLKLVLTRFISISAWQIVRHISEGWIHAVSVTSSIWQINKKKSLILSHARDADDDNIRVISSPLCRWHVLVCPAAQVCGRLCCLVWTLSATEIMINVKLSNCNQILWSKFNGRNKSLLIMCQWIFGWRYSHTEDFLLISPNKGSDGSFLKLTLYSMGYRQHHKKLSPW